MFEDDDRITGAQIKQINWAVLITVVVIIGLIIAGAVFTVIDLKAQHDIVNPQIRQNKIDDPDTTIANKADFHSKLGEIIKADQDTETDINLLSKYSQDDPNYDTAVNNLTGVEQIRSQAITTYNEEADNPDKAKDLDPWMPRHIAVTSIPSDNGQAITFLNGEIAQLDTSYNHQGAVQ